MWGELVQRPERPLTNTFCIQSISSFTRNTVSEGVTHHVSLPALHAGVSGKGGTAPESTGESRRLVSYRLGHLSFLSLILQFLSSSTCRTPLCSACWSSPPLCPGINWTCPHTKAFWDMSAPTTPPLCCSALNLPLSCC